MDIGILIETDFFCIQLPELKKKCLFKDVHISFWHRDMSPTAGLLMLNLSPDACALANCTLMS